MTNEHKAAPERKPLPPAIAQEFRLLAQTERAARLELALVEERRQRLAESLREEFARDGYALTGIAIDEGVAEVTALASDE